MRGKKEKVGLDYRRVFCKTVKEETMLGKVRTAAFVAAMMAAGMGLSTAFGNTAMAADNWDITSTTRVPGDGQNIPGSGNSVGTIYASSNAGQTEGWSNANINIVNQFYRNLHIGNVNNDDFTDNSNKIDLTINSLDMSQTATGFGTLDIHRTNAGNGASDLGTTLTMKSLDARGFINIDNSSATSNNLQNRLITDTLTASQGILRATIDENSLFQVNTSTDATNSFITINNNAQFITGNGKNNDYFSDVTVTANGGEAIFNNVLNTSDTTTLTASNGGALRFNKDLIMTADDQIRLTGTGIADFSQMTKSVDLGDGTLYATGADNVAVVNNNGMVASKSEAISVYQGDVSLVLNEKDGTATGDLLITAREKALELIGNGTTKGALSVDDLTLDKKVQGNLFTDTTVNGVLNANTLTVNEGANVTGSADVVTTIANKSQIDGVYNMEGSGNIFQGDIAVSAKGVLGAADGTAITTGTEDKVANIIVSNGGALGTLGNNLTIDTAGDLTNTITFNGSSGQNKLLGTVDAQSSQLRVLNNLLVDGSLTGDSYTQSAGTVSTATNKSGIISTVNEDVVSVISGSSTKFEIDGSFAGGLNLTKGATIVGTGNIINSNGNADAEMYIDSLSSIDLSTGNMTVTGYKEIDLDGAILVGYNTGQGYPNYLQLDSNTHVTADLEKSVTFTNDFFNQYHESQNVNNQYIIKNGEFNNGMIDDFTKSSVFGDVTVTYNDEAAGYGAYISDADWRDVENLNDVKDYLGSLDDPRTVTDGFANYVSGTAMNILDPTKGLTFLGTDSGNANKSILQALARGDSTWDFNGVTRELGKDYAYVNNGSTLFGVTSVAKDSIRNVQDALNSRLDAFRAVRECVINECYASGTALGSANILNDRYLNRVWAGALGTWQNADKRKGYDGYKYHAGGGIIGYDRAFGAAVVGASFAFIDGNYKDKTFTRNDSKIRQYNGNLYATYNASSGFFFNVMGGYNYADNKLSYGLGDSDWKEKFHTQTWYASGKIGYDIMPCDNLSITPSVGVNYFYTRTNAHNARMTTIGADLTRIGKAHEHMLEMPVQVQVAYEIPVGDKGGLTLMADGGYTYNFRNKGLKGYTSLVDANALNGFDLPGTRIQGRTQGHHSWNAGAGVKFRYDRWEIAAKYDYIGRSKYNSHQVTGTVGYSF